jgi:hypothetical protein
MSTDEILTLAWAMSPLLIMFTVMLVAMIVKGEW